MPLIGITNCRKLEDYRQSVLHVGGEVRVLDPSTDIHGSLEGLDGLLLTGGGDLAPSKYGETPHPTVEAAEPGRDDFELGLVALARQRGLPILAICRGVQVLNVACGGSLFMHLPEDCPRTMPHNDPTCIGPHRHLVNIKVGTRLEEI